MARWKKEIDEEQEKWSVRGSKVKGAGQGVNKFNLRNVI